MEQSTRTNYVVGFLFSECKTGVVLIRKNRPTWQKGKLNGVGGHIEAHESPLEAMIREFAEETGVLHGNYRWEEFVEYSFEHATVHFFKAFDTQAYLLAQRVTDEIVLQVSVADAMRYQDKIYNLNWLIPLALDPYVKGKLMVHE